MGGICHFMPFGKYRNYPIEDVPLDYLRWALEHCDFSSGLRAAIRERLGLPAGPPPPPPRCSRCGNMRLRITWHEMSGDRRQIRADCLACQRFVSFLPLLPENVAAADATQPLAPFLDAMLRADAEGVTLIRRGDELELQPWGKASPELQELVRQAGHQLARLLPQRKSTT